MNFMLNSPALQTAGQILNQQCMASAEAARALRSAGRNAEAAKQPEDLILGAIAELTRAARTFRLANTSPEPLNNGLACAVANIFHLAASQNIDLGAAIAAELQYAVDNPNPF